MKLAKLQDVGGAGGSRTLVQTGKSYAFYMLIPDFGFRVTARPGPPTDTLASNCSQKMRGKSSAIPDILAPLYQSASRNGSERCLVPMLGKGIKLIYYTSIKQRERSSL